MQTEAGGIGERRRAYRETFDEDDDVSIVVRVRGESLAGRVLDLSDEGAGARFSREHDAPLVLGERVALLISAPWVGRPVELSARVHSVHMRERSWRYGFEFEDSGQLDGQIDARHREMFNRRSAFRVEPDPEEPVEVSLSAPGCGRVIGRMKDVSATGMAVLLDARAGEAAALAQRRFVEASFGLPPGGTSLTLVAQLRAGRVEEESMCYGLEFDPERSDLFQRQQEKVVEYVMHRQREIQTQKLELKR